MIKSLPTPSLQRKSWPETILSFLSPITSYPHPPSHKNVPYVQLPRAPLYLLQEMLLYSGIALKSQLDVQSYLVGFCILTGSFCTPPSWLPGTWTRVCGTTSAAQPSQRGRGAVREASGEEMPKTGKAEQPEPASV